jgi:nucleoside-diphosphate-sugar epimerase
MNFQDGELHWKRRTLSSNGSWRARDLWAYIDARDCARAFRLGVENVNEGHHVLLLSARDAFSAHDIRALVRYHYPQLAHQVEPLDPSASLYDTRLAETVLNWTPEHSWRDIPELRDAQPEPLDAK